MTSEDDLAARLARARSELSDARLTAAHQQTNKAAGQAEQQRALTTELAPLVRHFRDRGQPTHAIVQVGWTRGLFGKRREATRRAEGWKLGPFLLSTDPGLWHLYRGPLELGKQRQDVAQRDQFARKNGYVDVYDIAHPVVPRPLMGSHTVAEGDSNEVAYLLTEGRFAYHRGDNFSGPSPRSLTDALLWFAAEEGL